MKNPAKGILMDVLPMADCQQLSVKQACERFVARATQSDRAFAEMGKLHFALGKLLASSKGRTIYGELQKLGVSKSTISNASYASKVWEALIHTQVLSEAVYDGLSFSACRNICRVLGISGSSKKAMKPEEVKIVIESCPKDYEEQFESLADSGLSCAEREKAAKETAALKASEETAVKAAAAVVGTPATPATGTPAATPATTPAAANAPAVAEKAKAPKTPAAPVVPTLSEVLVTLDAVEAAIGKLPTEDQPKAVQRIVDLADLLTAPAVKAVGAAKDAAVALASIRLLLAQATDALAAGEIRLALVTMKAAAAQSFAALRTNGLAAVTGVLLNGLKMVGGLIGSVVRGAFAALATTAGLMIASFLTLGVTLFHVKRAMDAEADAVNASREASVAHTAALQEQIRAMLTVEDATRARASALEELMAAEEAARAARPENTSVGDRVMRNVFDIGKKAQLAAEDRVEVARRNLSEVDALDPSKFGTDEDTRQRNRQLAQDRQGAHFYKGVTSEKAQAEEDAKFATRASLQGWGADGKKLNALNEWRTQLRAEDPAAGAWDEEDRKKRATLHATTLVEVNAKIGAERKRIMEGSGSAEVRAQAKLAEDDERVDAHRRAGQAKVLAQKVQGASEGWFGGDKAKMKALAGETDDAELKRALLGSDRDAAKARASALEASAGAEKAASGLLMNPTDRQKAMDAVNDEQKRYDKAAVRQQEISDMDAGYEAQRAAGEQKLAALRDDGYDAAMAENAARGAALDLEEQITAEKLKQKLISDADATASTAQTAAQRAVLVAEARMLTAQTERDTKRASLTMKAGHLETQAADLRRQGRHDEATATEKMAEQNQLAARRIELTQEVKGMSGDELRRQGYSGREDYVNQGIAGEQTKLDQQRRFMEEDRKLTRQRAQADVGGAEGEVAGRVLKLGGKTLEARRVEEAARRQSDEVRREELRRQNIGTGMTAEAAQSLADRQVKTEQASRMLDILGTGVGTTVASSMAAIGGGGGVAGVDAMAGRQEIANKLLREIRDDARKSVTDVTVDNRLG